MSQLALLRAVRDTLRNTTALGLDRNNCEITHQGKPFPIANEWFVSVWHAYWRDNGSNGQCLDTKHGFYVTASMRTSKFPEDRLVEALAAIEAGLLAKCEAIVATLHVDPRNLSEGGVEYSAVLLRANQIIGSEANGFIEPPQFRDGGQPTQQPATWWGGKPGDQFAGLSQTMSFGEARRVQTIESQT